MTRETLPRFDLYGELEVSPFASVGTIEAAYRSLVKQHHPDVASGDESRMTRLNLAREWLTDPQLRRRYDQETDRGRQIADRRRPVATHSVVTRSNAERRAAGARPPVGGTAGARDAEPTFGIHADEVRQFLAEIRSLDRARAQRVWNGRAVAHTKGYTEALRAAASAARGERKAEWQFAREAAGVIARGKLGDSTLTDQVADVLSDVAGAIAIRDLLSPGEFSLVLMPWTWRGTVKLPDVQAPTTPSPDAPRTEPAPRVEDRSSLDDRRPVESQFSNLKSEAAFAATLQQSRPAAEAAPSAQAAPAAPVTPAVPVTPAAPATTTPAPMAPPENASAPKPAAPPAPMAPPRPAPPRKPATPFVAAAPPPKVPPSWPTMPSEPRARPPVDPAISARVGATPATRRSVRAAVFAPPPPRRIGTFPVLLAGASLILLLGSAVLMLPGARPNQAVAAATDAPTGSASGVALGSPAPATFGPSIGATDQPPATGPITGGGATPPPGPGATPRPTRPPGATPKPTLPPGATPTPTPTVPPPTPTPTPPQSTPEPTCIVPNFVGTSTTDAPALWTGRGFTGTISYIPRSQTFIVAWQSLAAGSDEACTTGITLRKNLP